MIKIKTIVFLLILFSVSSTIVNSQEIFKAVQEGNFGKVKSIIDKNPTLIITRDLNNRTPLHFAATTGNKQIAEYLLSKGADINLKNSDGRTPLHFAASNRQKDVVELLITNGADLEAKDIYDNTPLNSATYGGDIEIIKLMIEKGANIKTLSGYNGSLLHAAASRGRKDIIKLFVDKGLDINFQDKDGPAPIHIAAAGGNEDLVRFLVENGAKVNIKRRYNLIPLHIAAAGGHKEVVELLLKHGADINIRCSDGRTPLHMAEDFSQNNIVELLSAKSAVNIPRNFPALKGEYLGMKKPGSTPEIFAPGILLNILNNHIYLTFSPDSKQIYWYADTYLPYRFIWFMEEKDGTRSIPQIAPFSGEYYDRAPSYSPNEEILIFQSRRPIEKGGKLSYNIWFVEKINSGWSKPHCYEIKGLAVSPSISKDGTIYFQGSIQGKNIGTMDIFCIKRIDGKYTEPENLGPAVNSRFFEVNPYISPDQSFIIFSSIRPENYHQRHELYISFRTKENTWTKAKNMGEVINDGTGWVTSSTLSPDGRFLFFAKRTHGISEFYWVDAEIINDLREN
ncbi:MAG: ankyrin repeat domain-containing protein [Candidatus Aminicenantes bacterium]|nr:MAG: ankyrin repeat domain-containing protein [Candidatus Aminicenantes bacterium]